MWFFGKFGFGRESSHYDMGVLINSRMPVHSIMNIPSRIPGVKIGHAQNLEAATGCTVILTVGGAVCGVDQRGGAPCTRDTDKLRPMHLVEEVQGILLTGGSTFGLSAADGVVKWLEERSYGFNAGVAHIPIVPSAALFDLNIGSSVIRPDSKMGYYACENAIEDLSARAGTIGAGTGATIGGILGPKYRMKGGLGTDLIKLENGILVGAIIAVNCYGDVINPKNGQIIAGARKMSGDGFANTMKEISNISENFSQAATNTVIGAIMTNATLSKEEVNKVAQMAHNGIARIICPASTMFDGDTIFALATCEEKKAGKDKKKDNVNIIGALAAEATSEAIVNAVHEARSLYNFPSLRRIMGQPED
jgi:L-aminopeptidase/D-esterase-like protein